jgi:hypothetical protein
MLRSKGGVEDNVLGLNDPFGRLIYLLVPFKEDAISVCKSKIPGRAVDLVYALTLLMTESSMGYGVNARCLIFFPVAKLKNLYVPCKLPVGPSTSAGVKQVTMVFVGISSS